MDFPHISDTNFPNLNKVDVFKYQNNFDYGRWTGKVSIKFLNVLWNSNYADVPGFENDEERDKWFDTQDGLIHTLESAFNITPENSVRVPVPYNDAYRFNYLVVDMPIQTSIADPIDYEFENTRVKRWYYFIDSMTQFAPSTTELHLTLDVWTTFINTVNIPYLMLERGHAPMLLSNVDDYLDNPIENSEYLLAQDFNYGTDARVVKETSYFPIGNGRKYVLFALPMTQADLISVGGANSSGASTPPTFSNTSERWGYQIVVNDYEWNFSNGNYNNAQLPISAFLNQDSVFNGNYVFAVASENASTFFGNIANNAVHLLHAIQGVFIVAEDMISLGTAFTFKGINVYQVSKQYTTYDLSLNKEAFDFDEKYENIAKLYTYPYSVLEVTDDNGFSREVRIENTGNIQFHKEISIAFPFVRYQSFFTGFNGDGELNYTWRNLNNSDVAKTMWEDDFSVFMMNWDIPTYAVYASMENEYAALNWPGMQAARQGAIIDYENAVRYANTNYENTDDETDTMQANVATQNSANSAITNENALASVENTLRGNVASSANAQHNINKLHDDYLTDTQLSATLTGLQNDVLTATTSINNTASIDAAGLGGIPTALTNPTNTGAAIGGIIGAVVSANAATDTNAIVIGTSWAQLIDVAAANGEKYLHAQSNIHNVTTETNSANSDITDRSQRAMVANTATQNAANTSIINATCATTDNNADWTRDANVVASQNNLAQRQREWEGRFKNARLAAPMMETQYAGDAYPDVFERRGVRFNLRTQSKSAIAQTGDAMLRFGYAIHRVWDMTSGFHYGKHFTFWKAEDIWINEGTGLAGNSVNIIGDILLKGVTVWRKPDEIGKVSIYDNV